MSTAKKRTIKYVAFVSVLILIVSYFSLLSPTSAYFYKTETKGTTIIFATFDVDEEQTVFDNNSVMKFKGATKLCDTEELLFDEVAIEKEVILENKGEAPARILVHITPDEESVAKGLRYVAFIEKIENEPETAADGEEGTEGSDGATTSEEVKKGSIKTELEELFEITAESTHEEIEGRLNTYNEEFKSKYVTLAPPDKETLAPGEKAKVRIIFWAEYDSVLSYLDNVKGEEGYGEKNWQNAGNLENIEYLCHVEIIASQDENAAVDTLFKEETTVAETTENTENQ